MHAFLSSQTTILLAMGMSAYLGLLHLGYGRRWKDPHPWVALWSVAALGFQAARYAQLSTDEPLVALVAARACLATVPFMILGLCGFARSLAGRPLGRRAGAVLLGANAAFAAALSGTGWFLTDQTSPRIDWFGHTYLGVHGRWSMLALAPYIAIALGWVVRELYRSSEVAALERNVVVGCLAAYAGLGLLSVLSSAEWISMPGSAEYGPFVLGGGLSFLLVHRQRRLEDALQSLVDARTAELAASEARYRGLIDNAPIGIFACDPLGRVTMVNPRLLEILGIPSDSPLEPRNVLSSARTAAAGVADSVRRCLGRGTVVTAEHRYTSAFGRTADVRLLVAPIRGPSGAVTGALGLAEDVSERRALEEGLRRSQKLESVGQLAAGIAHEINNPMAFVRTNLAVLREEWHALRKQLPDAGREASLADRFGECEALIDESLEGIERTIAIARDMREFAHVGSDGRSAIEVNQVLEACVRVASPHRRGATRIEEAYGDVPPVWGSAGQLRQVFVNLLVNALQAVGQVGTVRVETALDNERAVVRVRDDGAGIQPEHRDRLFDPFFTTKPAGEGTGLGLYVSHEIVRGHGGEIHVTSSPGQGATFEVRLPLARANRDGGDDEDGDGI